MKIEAVALEKNRNEFKILDNKRLEIEAQLKKVEQFEKVEKLLHHYCKGRKNTGRNWITFQQNSQKLKMS